jgi:hypothetical protein
VTESGFTSKNLGKALAGLIGLPLLLIGIVVVFEGGFGERDYRYRSNLAAARSAIHLFLWAADLYTMKYGHPPKEITDLVPGPSHLPGGVCFLSPRYKGAILSPWRTPYHLEIAQTPSGDKVVIWTVPDQETQKRLHTPRFTDRASASEWPGDAKQGSQAAKDGFPCDSPPIDL